MATGELHLQLSVNFPDNRKVRALVRYGRDVRALRDLYVQMCLYSKGMLSDGFVPDEQIGLLVYPDTEKNGQRDAQRLAEVGLLEKGAGGWQIEGWFDRNQSKENVKRKSEAKARGARLANHRRWHEEGGTSDPDCEWCQKSDQTTDLTSDQTTDQSSVSTPIDAAKRSDSTETESETETESKTEKPSGRQAGHVPEPGSDADPDFCAFWDAYPKRAAKGQARKTWKTLVVKKRIDPKVLILGAERYRDDPRRPRDLTYVPNPSTWLNGERWLEQQDDSETTANGQAPAPRRITYSNNPLEA